MPAVLTLDSSLRSELYARNSECVLEIPAVSRLMTLYLASERLAVDAMIVIGKETARLAEHESAIDIPLKEGDSFPIRYMLLRMICQQSDAAAVALAEKMAESKEDFITEMQKTAAMLGMNQTTFFACDVARAERESEPPSEIADAIVALDEYNALNTPGDVYKRQPRLDHHNFDLLQTRVGILRREYDRKIVRLFRQILRCALNHFSRLSEVLR